MAQTAIDVTLRMRDEASGPVTAALRKMSDGATANVRSFRALSTVLRGTGVYLAVRGFMQLANASEEGRDALERIGDSWDTLMHTMSESLFGAGSAGQDVLGWWDALLQKMDKAVRPESEFLPQGVKVGSGAALLFQRRTTWGRNFTADWRVGARREDSRIAADEAAVARDLAQLREREHREEMRRLDAELDVRIALAELRDQELQDEGRASGMARDAKAELDAVARGIDEAEEESGLKSRADARKRDFEARVHWAKQAYMEEHRLRLAAVSGIEEYGKAARDVYAQISDFGTSAFRSLEDAMVRSITQGKLAFRDFAESVLADLTRIMVRTQITGPLAQAFGSFFAPGSPVPGPAIAMGGAVSHTGGVPGVDALPWRRFHGGGLASNEIPAILQRGEGVFTAGQMRALAPAQPVTVNVINQAGAEVTTRERRTPQGRVVDVILKTVARDVAQGGVVAQAVGAAFGARRAGRVT